MTRSISLLGQQTRGDHASTEEVEAELREARRVRAAAHDRREHGRADVEEPLAQEHGRQPRREGQVGADRREHRAERRDHAMVEGNLGGGREVVGEHRARAATEVEVLDHDPATRSGRGDHPGQRAVAVGEMFKQSTSVYEVVRLRVEVVGQDVVRDDLEAGPVGEEPRIEVRGDDLTRCADPVGQPPGGAAGAGPDLQAPPPLADTEQVEPVPRGVVEQVLQGGQPLALALPRLVVQVGAHGSIAARSTGVVCALVHIRPVDIHREARTGCRS